MAKYVLEILDGDRAGDIVSVTEKPLRIGRKPTNDLSLADEKTSGVHCEIVLEGDRHVLRDLGSTNGTFIDQKRVTEVVLTSGDVITVGRLRVKFRDENGQSGGGVADLAVHRLDATRVQKRGGTAVLVAVLVALLAGGGAFYFWQGQRKQEEAGGGAKQQVKAPVDVPGNKLTGTVAACDVADGWLLEAGGAGFHPTLQRNSGEGAFEATRPAAGEGADFAVATLATPIPVLSGRALVIAAWVQTQGRARVGVRGVCFSSSDAGAQRFRHGTALAAGEGWQRIEVELAVPPGCDRLDLELVALVPDADSSAVVDDVAVTEGGGGKVLDHRMAEGGQTLIGTGTALAVHSTEVTLLGLSGEADAECRGLFDAGLGALSDLGAALTVTPQERSVTLEVTEVGGIEFAFPAESAGQLMTSAAADGVFEPAAAASTGTAQQLLLGNAMTRVLLRTAAPVAFRGAVAGGVFRLYVASPQVEMVLGFRAERQQALGFVREAEQALAEGAPGRALDRLRELQRAVPFDSEALLQATRLRSTIFDRLDEELSRLSSELDEARFFDTRGGFERVQRGVDRLFAEYGENNMEGREIAAQLRTAAVARLDELDHAHADANKARLDSLAEAFTAAGEPGLAKLVQDYKQRLAK